MTTLMPSFFQGVAVDCVLSPNIWSGHYSRWELVLISKEDKSQFISQFSMMQSWLSLPFPLSMRSSRKARRAIGSHIWSQKYQQTIRRNPYQWYKHSNWKTIMFLVFSIWTKCILQNRLDVTGTLIVPSLLSKYVNILCSQHRDSIVKRIHIGRKAGFLRLNQNETYQIMNVAVAIALCRKTLPHWSSDFVIQVDEMYNNCIRSTHQSHDPISPRCFGMKIDLNVGLIQISKNENT
jgi:hypothetical protein